MSTNKTSPRIVLASGSPYRRELLSRLNQVFTVCSPDIDERARGGEAAPDLALRLAESKARAAAQSYDNALIIGSDQVAVLEQQLLGKPGSHVRACAQLQKASGKSMVFYTAVCLMNTGNGSIQHGVVPCTVVFRPLSQAMIEGYLSQEKPYDCAGAFKSEGLGIALLEKIVTEDPTALIGLPLIKLSQMLVEEGVDLFDACHSGTFSAGI